jgi:transposase-like protein
MSVSDIEEEMREIYEIELSTSAISIITNKVSQAAQEWQNRPLDLYDSPDGRYCRQGTG